jgi:uncharacterized OB-fold protein
MSARPRGAPSADLAVLHPDSWTIHFWEAAKDHRLTSAHCDNCGAFRMPPTPFCPKCLSQETSWPTLSGDGTVYSFTIIRHAVIPQLAESVPYVLAMVDLDDAPGARVFTNIVECDPETVFVGQPVRVVWDDTSDEVTIPRFTPR